MYHNGKYTVNFILFTRRFRGVNSVRRSFDDAGRVSDSQA